MSEFIVTIGDGPLLEPVGEDTVVICVYRQLLPDIGDLGRYVFFEMPGGTQYGTVAYEGEDEVDEAVNALCSLLDGQPLVPLPYPYETASCEKLAEINLSAQYDESDAIH